MTLSQNDLINTAVDKIKKYNIDCSGGTRIWDSLMSLINLASKDSNDKILLCVTDGADGGSNHSYDSVEQEISKYPNLELLILDIDGKLSSVNEKKDKIIQTIKKPQDIKKVLRSSGLVNPPKKTGESLNITVSVMPVIPCSVEDVNIVLEAVRESVSYIEQLTGLRYYPVPTYIVDEYTLKKYMDYPMPDRINDEELKKDIEEFFSFFKAIDNAIYEYNNQYKYLTGHLTSEEREAIWWKYFRWNDDITAIIVRFSQVHLAVDSFINQGTFNYDSYPHTGINSISNFLKGYRDDISRYKAMMIELKQYLRYKNELDEEFDRIDPKHFDESIDDRKNDIPILERWKKYLKHKDYNQILNSLQKDGSWKKDIDSIVTVFEIALPILIKLLKEWQKLSSKWLRISKVIRTFGVYIHPNSESKKLNDLFIKNKFPAHFIDSQGGKVLICLERCKKRLENIIDDETQDGSIDANDLFARLIKSTIIHEHTHAITLEGVGNDPEPYYRNKTGIDGKKYKAVSETLAEWAELNYFRIHGDKELYDIVFNHANSDQFPDWAYAGALILERPDNDLPAEVLYRTLLKCFRINTNVAYRLLRY